MLMAVLVAAPALAFSVASQEAPDTTAILIASARAVLEAVGGPVVLVPSFDAGRSASVAEQLGIPMRERRLVVRCTTVQERQRCTITGARALLSLGEVAVVADRARADIWIAYDGSNGLYQQVWSVYLERRDGQWITTDKKLVLET